MPAGAGLYDPAYLRDEPEVCAEKPEDSFGARYLQLDGALAEARRARRAVVTQRGR